MYKKLMGARMALAAALAVIPASASAVPTLTEGGVAVAAGSTVVGTLTNPPLKMTNAAAATLLECTTATITGKVHSNPTPDLAVEITAFNVGGTGATKAGEPEPECTGMFGNFTFTTHASAANPWCLTGLKSDQFEVRGGACTSAAKNLTFTLDSTTVGVCEYSAASVTGTYTTGGAQAVTTITKAKFTKVSGSFLCPAEGFFDMEFKLETSNGTALTIS
jgi:hypothetical protein